MFFFVLEISSSIFWWESFSFYTRFHAFIAASSNFYCTGSKKTRNGNKSGTCQCPLQVFAFWLCLLNHSKELRVGLLGSSGRFPVCVCVWMSVHFCAGDAVLRDAVLPLLTRLLYDCVNAILYLHNYYLR